MRIKPLKITGKFYPEFFVVVRAPRCGDYYYDMSGQNLNSVINGLANDLSEREIPLNKITVGGVHVHGGQVEVKINGMTFDYGFEEIYGADYPVMSKKQLIAAIAKSKYYKGK